MRMGSGEAEVCGSSLKRSTLRRTPRAFTYCVVVLTLSSVSLTFQTGINVNFDLPRCLFHRNPTFRDILIPSFDPPHPNDTPPLILTTMEPSSSNTGFFQEMPVVRNQFHDDVSLQRVAKRIYVPASHSHRHVRYTHADLSQSSSRARCSTGSVPKQPSLETMCSPSKSSIG